MNRCAVRGWRRPLTPAQAARVFDALNELHRVCDAMDADRPGPGATEAEYQTAMIDAAEALERRPRPLPRRLRRR